LLLLLLPLLLLLLLLLLLKGGDEPVWRQLLRPHLDHPNRAVAQQAATALAETQ
jgi:hypothetical protein